MADAARSARSAFQDIGDSASGGTRRVVEGTTDVRHSLGLMDNAIRGNHAAAMVDLVRLFQNTSLVMGAIPFAGAIGGFLLLGATVVELVNKFHEWREAGEKLRNAMTEFGTSENELLNSLKEKFLAAEERADELRNDHLAALHHQLILIDMQSMSELVHSFQTVAKAADVVFGQLKSHWYTLGSGSTGAQHALEQFKVQYESLLAQGKDKDASSLLHGTLENAQKILDLQRQASAGVAPTSDHAAANAAYERGARAHLELQKLGVGFTQSEVDAQATLVDALNKQLEIENGIAQIKKLDSDNAKTATAKDAAQRRAEAGKQAADAQMRIDQLRLQADRATAGASLDIQRASIAERLQSDLDFASREHQIQEAANQAQVAALDKGGKDYANQLAALHEKAAEIDQQYQTQVAQLRAKAAVEQAARDLANLQQSERAKIEATDQGSAERLAAIDAAIREEQARGLQDTEFYRSLLTERVAVLKASLDEKAKLLAAAGTEEAQHEQRMGEMSLAAEKMRQAVMDSTRRMTIDRQAQEARAAADEEFRVKQVAIQREIAALDTGAKDYENKLKALQDKERELYQQHENDITAIREKAEIERNQRVLSAETSFNDAIARGLTQAIMGHESFAKMVLSLGDQVVSGMMQNAIKDIMADDMTRERDAAYAARQGFKAGMHLPFPANIIAAPALAASAFAAVMAFESGTDSVPGVGKGDIVPAKLEPGEGVVPGGVMDGLRNVARNGGFQQHAAPIHVHVRPVYNVQALDSDGFQDVLERHTDALQRHFENTVRKMNR